MANTVTKRIIMVIHMLASYAESKIKIFEREYCYNRRRCLVAGGLGRLGGKPTVMSENM